MILINQNINVVEISSSQIHLHQFSGPKEDVKKIGHDTFETIEQALDQLKNSKPPLFLYINNNQVITQQIDSSIKLDEKNSINFIMQIFSINTDDFFYHIDHMSTASIIRKSYLENILNTASNKDIRFSKCYFGSTSLISFIENSKEITFYGDFKVLQQKLEKASNSIQKNYFYQIAAVCIIGSLIVFSATYYGFQYPKLLKLKEQKTFNNERLLIFNNLKTTIEQQEKLINQINKLSNTNIGNYIDQILLIKPSSILLNQINFQPILKKVKKDKDILFDQNQIIIRGYSKVHDDIQKWIFELEALTLIKSVEILTFNDLKTTSEFKLAIYLNENKETSTK
ncbi:hypothetical protein ACXGQW_04875 [Wenyingzhuangia sp. IMCC45533]